MPGDLAIYSHSDVGYIHVGQVLYLESGLLETGSLIPKILSEWDSETGSPIPKILSKWDDASGEYIHYPGDVHFRDNFLDFQLKYWTDRTL